MKLSEMKTTRRLHDNIIRYSLSGGAIVILTFAILGGHQKAKSQTKGDDRIWPPPEMKMSEYNPLQDWRGRL